MQTSLDWFLENLPERFKYALLNTCEEGIKKAKQKEKEQIENAYWASYKEGQYSGDKTAEEYYNETYKQKSIDAAELLYNIVKKEVDELNKDRYNK